MMSQPGTATTHVVQLGGLEPPTSWSTVSVPRYSWNFCGFPTIAKTLALHALVIESVSGNSWELPCGGSLVVPGSLANGGWKCAIVGSPKNWWIGGGPPARNTSFGITP